MNCERIKELFADVLIDGLDETTQGELEAHLNRCTSCREELTSLQSTWAQLSLLPEQNPSSALDERVRATLSAYREETRQPKRTTQEESHNLPGWLLLLWPKQTAPQFAMALLLFALGLLLGAGLARRQPYEGARSVTTDPSGIAQLREEVATMKQLLTVSLLAQPSASERLRGIEWTSRLEQPDAQVLSVLLRLLDLDPNVNVRLAAVDALQQFYREPSVRLALIEALRRPQSPAVHVGLIEAMVRASEKGSVAPIKSLLQNPGIDPSVRERAQWALQKLS